MEGPKNKVTMVVAEINRVNEENHKLGSMVKIMTSKYNDLQKHIRSLVQQQKHGHGSQIFNPDHQSKKVLCPEPINVDSGRAVPQQSDQSSGGEEKEKKNVKSTEDHHLPSKKRMINYMQSENIENGISSSMDNSPRCHGAESSNKNLQVPSRGSGKETAAARKRIVAVRTRSDESARADGCLWRKYGQKMTRNNPLPRSYYKCACAQGCPVKKQVQRCAHDSTLLITTYEGEHTHPLGPLAMAVTEASSSNQVISERPSTVNFVADNQFLPCIATISTSNPSPTITLDLTGNWPNRGSQFQPPHLAAGSFRHFSPLFNGDQNQLGNRSVITQDSATSINL